MDREHQPAAGGRFASASFHLVGVLTLVVAAVIALAAWWVLTFGTAYCRDAPPAGDLIVVKLGVVVIGAALATIPLVIGKYARDYGRVAVPWFATAGVIAVATLAYLPAAEPMQFCF